jgi:hypothetical protein
MRSLLTTCVIGVSLLTSVCDADATESVGNMKRIIVPEKGPPVTTVAPNSANQPAGSKGSGISNPARVQVPVRSMIGGGVQKGGPIVPSPLQ